MNTLEEIKRALIESKKIIIATHEYPDGDGIGSSIALWLSLKQLGKNVTNVVEGHIPEEFAFLNGYNEFINPQEVNLDQDTTLVFLDCADENRAGKTLSQKRKQSFLVINIDHHQGNTNFGHLNYIEPNTASTGEIIYDLINLLKIKINSNIANAIYTAIVTDTGGFRYDNTTEKTFGIAQDLLKKGVNLNLVRTNLWESKSKNSLGLLGDCLSTMKFALNEQIAFITVTQAALDKWKINLGDLEGMVNYPKSIKGVKVAILFKEISKDETKVSFRSKEDVDVSKIANEFGGGGHKKAAGCTIKMPLNKAIDSVINFIEKNKFIG